MKYKGLTIKAPSSELVVFPRTEVVGDQTIANDLAFLVSVVLDFTEFDAVCPEPEPPKRLDSTGIQNIDLEDKDYNKALLDWSRARTDWMVLKSLSAPPPHALEWETIKMQEPETWKNYREELKDLFLTPTQIQHLINQVMSINSVDHRRMEEAKKRFLTGRQQQEQRSHSQKDGQPSTASGVPAKGSV